MASTTRILVGRRMAVTLRLCAAEKKTRPASRARRRLPFCRSRAAKLGRSPIFPKVPATQSGLPTTRPLHFSVRLRRKTSPRQNGKRRNPRTTANQRNQKPPRTPPSQNRRSRKANTNPMHTLSTARSTATTTKATLIPNATITFGCSMCLPHPTSSQSLNSSPPESSTKPSLSGATTARAFTSSPGVIDEPYYELPTTDMYSVPSAGGDLQKLATVPMGIGDLALSPDGRRLAFHGAVTQPVRSYSQPDVWVMDVTSNAQPRNLTANYDFDMGDSVTGDNAAPRRGNGRTLHWSADE